MYMANNWDANLSITGCDGMPAIQSAGNVVRASTSLRLSMRLSPAAEPSEMFEKIK